MFYPNVLSFTPVMFNGNIYFIQTTIFQDLYKVGIMLNSLFIIFYFYLSLLYIFKFLSCLFLLLHWKVFFLSSSKPFFLLSFIFSTESNDVSCWFIPPRQLNIYGAFFSTSPISRSSNYCSRSFRFRMRLKTRVRTAPGSFRPENSSV